MPARDVHLTTRRMARVLSTCDRLAFLRPQLESPADVVTSALLDPSGGETRTESPPPEDRLLPGRGRQPKYRASAERRNRVIYKTQSAGGHPPSSYHGPSEGTLLIAANFIRPEALLYAQRSHLRRPQDLASRNGLVGLRASSSSWADGRNRPGQRGGRGYASRLRRCPFETSIGSLAVPPTFPRRGPVTSS